MKINLSNDASQAAASSGAKVDRGAASASSPGLLKTERSTSGIPVKMSAAFRALDALPVSSGIDERKVAAVRAAIADGTFRVNAEAIADKLLSNAQEFLSHTRS